MWILIFLISMLITIEDKKKMYLLGTTFILVSAIIYYLFMVSWLNITIFLGSITIIKIIIASAAIIGGGYNLYSFFKHKEVGCKVQSDEKRKKIFEKVLGAVKAKSLILSVIGISIVAILVNFTELLCSAGLPILYTQILSLNEIGSKASYLYMLLYVFFFMLDDLLIFIISMVTLKVTGISTRYSRYTKLLGGILMITIGILLIYKPEILMFNF